MTGLHVCYACATCRWCHTDSGRSLWPENTALTRTSLAVMQRTYMYEYVLVHALQWQSSIVSYTRKNLTIEGLHAVFNNGWTNCPSSFPHNHIIITIVTRPRFHLDYPLEPLTTSSWHYSIGGISRAGPHNVTGAERRFRIKQVRETWRILTFVIRQSSRCSYALLHLTSYINPFRLICIINIWARTDRHGHACSVNVLVSCRLHAGGNWRRCDCDGHFHELAHAQEGALEGAPGAHDFGHFLCLCICICVNLCLRAVLHVSACMDLSFAGWINPMFSIRWRTSAYLWYLYARLAAYEPGRQDDALEGHVRIHSPIVVMRIIIINSKDPSQHLIFHSIKKNYRHIPISFGVVDFSLISQILSKTLISPHNICPQTRSSCRAFPAAFQQSYSWLLVNLKQTNEALKAASTIIQSCFQPIPVREVCRKCQKDAQPTESFLINVHSVN